MPHEIDTTTGSAAVFVAGTPPWHGLGRNVQEAISSQQANTTSPRRTIPTRGRVDM